MIIPMKKIFLVVQDKDVVPSLDALKNFGAVHVEHIQKPAGTHVQELRENIHRLEKVIAALSQLPAPADQVAAGNAGEAATEILGLLSLVEQMKETLASRQSVLQQWEPWGDFNPSGIELLQEKGIFIRFVELSEKELTRASEDVVLHPVFVKKGIVHCLAISREKMKLPYTSFSLPSAGVAELRRQQDRDRKRVADAEQNIRETTKYLSSFHQALNGLREDLMFEETYAGRGREERLAVLKGFCPTEICAGLEKLAKNESWGCLIDDPAAEDNVPTLVRNPKWVDVIKPVFGVINVFPGYREVDISPVFLIFFSIFFGILVGDAGYGLVLLALTAFSQNKSRGKVMDQTPFILTYLLCVCAVIWGALTGTFFGTVLFAKTLKPLMAWLTQDKNVQLVCFTIGVIHLSIAHLWRFTMKYPDFSAYAEIGWVLILWSMFFLANMMIIGMPLVGVFKYLLIAGILLVVADILRGPKSNIFTGFILSFFSIISAFTDIVSYIRLFAVGLAGVAVANAFSQMALSIGFNSVVSGIITSLILVGGHLFNIVLCGFGLLVHGLRLNVLEFSGHLGLEWSGFKYEPFKKLSRHQ